MVPQAMRDAIILAAGLGSRLSVAEPCKPLTRLHGMTLLELAIRQLAEVGITRVRVATGYKADAVEAELHAIARRVPVTIEPRRVADYHKPNGHSLLRACEGFGGEFLLQMADHVFAPSMVRQISKLAPPDRSAVLAIDKRIDSPLIDPDDATWVETRGTGEILTIGKAIPRYDCVDCGLFRTSQSLADAIRAAIARGKPGSLSDGMQMLADHGHALTMDILDAWWIDIDDPHALALAREQSLEHIPLLTARQNECLAS